MPGPAAFVATTAMKFVVSGDHTGFRSVLDTLLGSTWVGADPFALITQRRRVPLRFEENAMRVPSGDHEGSRSNSTAGSGSGVRLTKPVPSAFSVTMSAVIASVE